MPLSCGSALINRGAPFPIYKANLGAPSSQGRTLSYLSGNFGRALINRGAPFSISKATLGAPFSQVLALSYLSGNFGSALLTGARPFQSRSNFGRALTNRGKYSSILLDKLKHTLSHL
jgi:hypothetical protein